MFDQGFSQIDGVTKKGKHNYDPSLAVDIIPYPVQWPPENPQTAAEWRKYVEAVARFYFLAGVMFEAARYLGVTIRWGGDWNRNMDFTDQSFYDLPHFEVVD